jgi:hypothetical protein
MSTMQTQTLHTFLYLRAMRASAKHTSHIHFFSTAAARQLQPLNIASQHGSLPSTSQITPVLSNTVCKSGHSVHPGYSNRRQCCAPLRMGAPISQKQSTDAGVVKNQNSQLTTEWSRAPTRISRGNLPLACLHRDDDKSVKLENGVATVQIDVV